MSTSTTTLFSKLAPIIQRHHSGNVPFPEHFAALKHIAIKQYTVYLQPYKCTFEALDGECYTDIYPENDVKAPIANTWTATEDLPKVLENVRNKVIDYKGFLEGSARAGVHHYVIDFQNYYAKYCSEDESNVYTEAFPAFFKDL
jgi:uncharacterized protein YbcV (DUF1398 family)